MECVELQEVRDLKKTLYEQKRADVSSTRIRFIFKGTINMQKSTLALALASIIVMGGGEYRCRGNPEIPERSGGQGGSWYRLD